MADTKAMTETIMPQRQQLQEVVVAGTETGTRPRREPVSIGHKLGRPTLKQLTH